MNLLRILLFKSDATDEDPGRENALAALSVPLMREGFEAYYGDDDLLYVRHVATRIVSSAASPHRPLTPAEVRRRTQLAGYLEMCSEDELIEVVLLPMFRQLGFHRVTVAGHKDKALEGIVTSALFTCQTRQASVGSDEQKPIICALGGQTEIAQKVPILGECDNAVLVGLTAKPKVRSASSSWSSARCMGEENSICSKRASSARGDPIVTKSPSEPTFDAEFTAFVGLTPKQTLLVADRS